jgi:Glucose-regulated metallo-peptidase M90/O-methyltransferase domain
LNRLLDVGGASGTWTIEFLRANPSGSATIFDLPPVIPLAEKRLKEAGLSGRVKLVKMNFCTDQLPKGCDLAWVSAIVHQNSRLQNRRLFRRVYRAMNAGGRPRNQRRLGIRRKRFKSERRATGNTLIEGHEVRLGESWRTGAVLISWNHVLHCPVDLTGSRNVALHEFAHQLDEENGSADGAPILPRTSMYAAWARILGREYQALSEDAVANRPTLIDKYGATNPAEFFAVVTEYFSEQPQQLRERYFELYEELKLYYGQDPAKVDSAT